MVYLKTSDPAVGGKSILIQNAAIPVESGAETGQKSIRINNIAILLKDFPAWKTPEIGDKCLLIRDKNLCIPVYQKNIEMPTDGLIFYASLSEEKSTAETGQNLNVNGTVTYQVVDKIPCANFDGHSHITAPFALITGKQTRTMSVWIKTPKTSSWKTAFYFGQHSDYKNFWVGQGDNGTLSAYAYNADIIGPENDGEWHNMCAVYDGSVFKLYVDGILAGSGSYNLNTASSDIYIACNANRSDFFTGSMAGCRIYNRVLTDDEIQLLAEEFIQKQPDLDEKLIFYAPLAADMSTAETGQAIEKNGNISFETVSGVPCARFDSSSYFKLTPSGTEFKFLTQTRWSISFHILFERGTDESDDLEGVLCSEEPNRNGALFSYRYIRGWSTSVQNSFGIGVNGNSEFTTPANLFLASTWYFVAIERNGSAIRIRINDKWYDGGNNTHVKDALKLYLPGGSPKLKGAIAGFRIYNRILSEEEYSFLKNEF